ncbi:hypothetical protein FIC94_22035 [Ochrobactrum teleogrylli]|uniref:Uncharacterized protein n=1 Tax=Ochrobactrum teleogrylli TaxID=2479765 RepID=A0ABY2XY67_9HYPH|nr:hypothetical protein [[Ochrobactrum] teleogrylli]TNV09324.1 hypothetical protein FIC94_22035 [[Ochrobactrum] teleogrylli]
MVVKEQLDPANNDIIDYWGEGRIIGEDGIDIVTGFPNAYNINYQYKLVSNGANTNRKIPNRIPTHDYDNVSVEQYVKAGSCYKITSMGSPITENTVKEIMRLINPAGRVILYGIDTITPLSIERVRSLLSKKDFVELPDYDFPSPFSEIRGFDKNAVFLNIDTVELEFLERIRKSEFWKALPIIINNRSNTILLKRYIDSLLKEDGVLVFQFACYLWYHDGQQIVRDYFDRQFVYIFSEQYLFIASEKYDKYLKPELNPDTVGDRALYGGTYETQARFIWRFILRDYGEVSIIFISRIENTINILNLPLLLTMAGTARHILAGQLMIQLGVCGGLNIGGAPKVTFASYFIINCMISL